MVRASNHRAIGFYRHVGFRELPSPDVHIFAMDLTPAGDNPQVS